LSFLEYPESWQLQAKCAETVNDEPKYDPDLWYPPRDKRLYKPLADKAKSICYGRDGLPPCPVRFQCLMAAERNDEVHGIWGGMSHRERNALKRKAKKAGYSFEEYVVKQTRQ
jgi:hypothetical protein